MRRILWKLVYAVGLLGYFLWELVLSNLRIARDVVRPQRELAPAVVAIPLDLTSGAQITMLANLITLTPGTLSLDVSSDRKTLYIHAMSGRDPEAVRQGIKRGFERRIQELFS